MVAQLLRNTRHYVCLLISSYTIHVTVNFFNTFIIVSAKENTQLNFHYHTVLSHSTKILCYQTLHTSVFPSSVTIENFRALRGTPVII
jgi:hypothetical protein